MDKIASYKEVIYKEAAIKADYTIRDANLKEKMMHGAEKAYKGAKGAGKAYKDMLKASPAARMATLGAAGTTGAFLAAGKIADKKREKDTKTKSVRDYVLPEMKRSSKTAPIRYSAIPAAIAVGALGASKGNNLAKRAIIKGNISGQKNAERLMNIGTKAGMIGGATGAIATGNAVSGALSKRDAHKTLDKLSEKHLGRKGTDVEHKKIDESYASKFTGQKKSMITPESEVQKRRRVREKYQQKKASECLDEMYKEAGIVNHVSKMTNGIKRTGQLLTGSHARKLNKELTSLRNKPVGSLKDSMNIGNKMMSTEKALGKEIGKVKAARIGTAGAVGTAGVGIAGTKKKDAEQGMTDLNA